MQLNNSIISVLLILLLVSLFVCDEEDVPPTPVDPEHARWVLSLALEKYDDGDYDDALEYFTSAIKWDSSYHVAYYHRGRFYYIRGETKRAINDFTKAITLDPAYSLAYHERGRAYYVRGKYKRAIDDLTKAIELNPYSSSTYYRRGQAYYKNKDNNRAVADCTKAIELRPHFYDAYLQRAHAYNMMGDPNRAFEDFDIVEQWRGDQADFSISSLSSGNDSIVVQLTQAIEQNPNDVQTVFNRGRAFYRGGEYNDAIADFTKAIVLNPHFILALFKRGAAYYHIGDYDNAITDLNQVIGFDVSNFYPGAYYKRGLAYQGQYDYYDAIDDYDTVIEMHPYFGDVYYQRGKASADKPPINNTMLAYRLARGNYKEAIEDYTRAIELDCSMIRLAYTNRSLAHKALWDSERANADRKISKKFKKAR